MTEGGQPSPEKVSGGQWPRVVMRVYTRLAPTVPDRPPSRGFVLSLKEVTVNTKKLVLLAILFAIVIFTGAA